MEWRWKNYMTMEEGYLIAIERDRIWRSNTETPCPFIPPGWEVEKVLEKKGNFEIFEVT